MVVGVILAGGSGTRLNYEKPKQFVEFNGIPLIAYSLKAFQSSESITNILVVCKDGFENELREIAERFSISKLDWIVPGGNTHQESLTNALEFLHKRSDSEFDVVVIHNANRPLVTVDLIEDSVRTCKQKGSGISALGCVDTIMRSETAEYANQFLERSEIIRAQSPQSYRLAQIYDVYDRAKKEGLTDRYECDLMTYYGNKIYFSKGSEQNIKITVPEDVKLFSSLLGESLQGSFDPDKQDEKTLRRERLQSEAKQMMDIVMAICKKHDLTCYLAYGTLLGAERHGGFIPWDDDIDLMIHMDEYLQLEKYLKEELPEEYFLQSFQTDRYYGLNWMKVRKNGTTCVDKKWNGVSCHGGLALDIFQISYVPNSHLSYLFWKFLYRVQHTLINTFPMDCKPGLVQKERKKHLYNLLLCVPYQIRYAMARLLDPVVFGKKRLRTKRAIAGNVKEVYPAEVFEGRCTVAFAGGEYYAPERYKEFLTCRYGNYMALPPVKKRVGHNYTQINFDEQFFFPSSVRKNK